MRPYGLTFAAAGLALAFVLIAHEEGGVTTLAAHRHASNAHSAAPSAPHAPSPDGIADLSDATPTSPRLTPHGLAAGSPAPLTPSGRLSRIAATPDDAPNAREAAGGHAARAPPTAAPNRFE